MEAHDILAGVTDSLGWNAACLTCRLVVLFPLPAPTYLPGERATALEVIA